jgi:hypothetical protein
MMPKWRNTIKIKHIFTENPSNQDVLKVTNHLIPQLEKILARENKLAQLSEYYTESLEEILVNFMWVRDSILENKDPAEYGFVDWCEAFNEYLDQLYDLGDEPTPNSTDSVWGEKFLWVG